MDEETEPGTYYENTEPHFSHPIQVYYVLIDLSNPMSSFHPSNWPITPKMNLEASRFGKHAVQHIQIPEAE
ncbi:hypothetical protein DAPPUDRAFT_231997 [Daphnia pulex]|uniref:Uncharacterized protein n=1 Tax=Daphnia pulex TaxID=6669 RepID=E9FRP0_DAPPU|nr:hypothetical protein DAPPUDRAFT_231997 [Daphnia pulex]|eukprot:EFX89888.1 hypothetical protein DAPPUDRAFT_231997 [Daphnia pulex]